MDLRGIDKLMEVLQKAAVRPGGSPPVVENGKLGVWRTIRGYRMFLELNGGKLGDVLIGPPSFQGKGLGDADQSVWSELTPEATRRKFSSVDVASGGVDRLKGAIRNSLGSKDTRREHLESVNTVEEVVPIARSAGFRDEEIAQALKGGEVGSRPPKLPNRLTRNKPRTPNIEREPAKGEPDSDFRSVVDAFNAPSKAERGDRAKQLAQSILDQADKQQDAATRLRLQAIGHALAGGAMSISQAREKVQEALKGGDAGKATPSKKEVDVLHDRVALKQFLDGYEAKAEKLVEAKLREASGSSERAKDLAVAQLIGELEAKVHVTEVKTELIKIREGIQSGKLSHRVGIRRILQILRLVLAFIPG